MRNNKVLFGIIVFVVVLGIIFLVFSEGEEKSVQSEIAAEWINLELKDVATGENFKISEFSDKPVLLESFAVWCPTCTRQQRVTRDFHEEVGDSVVSISIDMDPNEDEDRVMKHINDNGFNWYYAVSPVEFTQSLIDQFGVDIVNAPSVPMVLICDGQHARQLGSGVKSVDELKEEIARGC